MMACPNHPTLPAAAPCAGCGAALCENCLVEFLGGRYCGPCRDARLAQMHAAPPPDVEQLLESTARKTAIPHKNELAQGGLILSLLGLLPCTGRMLGPAAMALGIVGLRACVRDPEMPGKAMSIAAIALGALDTLVWWGFALFIEHH